MFKSDTINRLVREYREMLTELDESEIELIDVQQVYTLPDAYEALGKKLKSVKG
jgi:hypothetical protein